MMYTAADNGVAETMDRDIGGEIDDIEKWPVWLRLVIIISLSAALWAGILSGISALLG
tara:strand:- start:196 stop:369 length:174 start_codon:yes stop_codon:yes gene_type:complete